MGPSAPGAPCHRGRGSSAPRPLRGAPRHHPVPSRAASLLLQLALFAALCCHQCHGTANVTLATITLHKKFSWFTTPKIYFSCKRSNETLVMKAPVEALDITYNMTGDEEWQPVTRLNPEECQECEVFESTWMGKGHLTQWNVCTDNFSEINHASFIHSEPGYVDLNLSCPMCATAGYQHPFIGDESQLRIPPEVAPFFWIGMGVASLGAVLIIVGALAYLRKEERGDDQEKAKFIEMSEEEAGAFGGEHGHGHGPGRSMGSGSEFDADLDDEEFQREDLRGVPPGKMDKAV